MCKLCSAVVALGLAAGMNVLGALISTKVAKTVGSGVIASPSGHDGLVLVLAALRCLSYEVRRGHRHQH